jgi:hypothetical protein
LSPLQMTRTTAWPGRIVGGLPVLFLAFDAIVKLANAHQVAEASVQLGLPANLSVPLGLVLALCLVLYLRDHRVRQLLPPE